MNLGQGWTLVWPLMRAGKFCKIYLPNQALESGTAGSLGFIIAVFAKVVVSLNRSCHASLKP